MRAFRVMLAAGLVVIGGCSVAQEPEPIASACGELAGWSGPGVEIAETEAVEASGGTPAHCRVRGRIDGAIGFEVLLPVEWNGKFLMGGGGGFSGTIQNSAQDYFSTTGFDAGSTPLGRGYATSGTDTGHTASEIDASWALNDPEAEEDFAHEAVHRTAEVSKAIIADHYGGAAERSYFYGCSRGGGQAMVEAQRYPDDFDGIVAAAPAMDWPGIGAAFIRNQQLIYPDPERLDEPVITDDNQRLLAESILAACDDLDGVADGVLEDPRTCPFSPEQLPRCVDDVAGPDCVTTAQLAAIEVVYEGPVIGGERLFHGFPFGGENDPGGWEVWITGPLEQRPPGVPNLHFAFGTQMYKYLVFDDPDWNYATYDFSNWREETAAAAELLNGDDPDLGAFRDSGGKLILWHGWSDAALTALGSVAYWESVHELDPGADDYFRMFMLPGVGHCGGGPGADLVDWIAAIEGWVERGEAPERLLASKAVDGRIARTRPVCPYPQVAVWDGAGDTAEAASYRCAAPANAR